MVRSRKHYAIGVVQMDTTITAEPVLGVDGLVQVSIEAGFMSKVHRIDLSQQAVDKMIELLQDAKLRAAKKMKGVKKNG